MTLDCYLPYSITGNAVSLNGGLKYSCLSGGRRFFELPLSLAASQSWLVEGSESNPAELWYGASVVGGANSLELNLVDSGDFALYGADIEAKHITVNGFGKGVLGLVPKQFAFGGGEEARLNAGGGPVTLNQADLSGDGTVGELESYDTTTEPGHQISVAGNAYFDSASTITLSVEPLVPSRLAVSGILSLASPHLSLSTTFAEECPVLGQEFILITASGGIGGNFNGITNGGTTQAECRGVKSTFQIRYTANEVIATDIGEPPPPPPPSPPANTSPAVVAEIGSLRGNAPTYECRSGWSGSGTITTTATWMRTGSPVISQAASSPYIATSADAGQQLSCTVSASSAYGSANSTSGSIDVPGYWQPAVYLRPITRNEVAHPCSDAMDSACDNASTGLVGEIIPGSRPIQHWHFVYYPAAHASTPTQTQEEDGYTAGVLERCVGLCAGGSIEPYFRWAYYLAAYDGVWTYSAVVPYLAGGLGNPPFWNPLGSNYVLTLHCKAGCPAIQQDSGTLFGTAQSPYHGEEEAELNVQSFDPATGAITGLAKFFTSNAKMVVRGRLGEGLAYLQFFSLNKPPDLLTYFSDFTVGGTIDYGGWTPHRGYGPRLEGPLGTNGSTWEVCNNTSCPGPPGAVTKAVARSLSDSSGILGVTGSLVGFVPGVDTIDIGLGIFGLVTSAIADDPPDTNFEQLARPSSARPPAVHPSRGLNKRTALAATAVLRSLWQAAGSGEAFLNSVQRFQGATQAKNGKWRTLQIKAAIRFGHTLAAQYRHLAQLLTADRPLLMHSALVHTHLSASRSRRARTKVQQHGLPTKTLSTLRALGFTQASIKNARKLLAKSPIHSGNPLRALTDPAFNASLIRFAQEIEEYAHALAAGSAQ